MSSVRIDGAGRDGARPGLRLLPRDGEAGRAIAVATLSGLGFGVYMALADALLFRAIVPASQTEWVRSTPALRRILALIPPSVLDEILFRWLLVSALVWLLTAAVSGRRRLCWWLAIIAAAVIYVPFHPGYLGTPPLLLREAALYVSAGTLWGWLYWRHGLLAAIVGHLAAHVTLQPLLGCFFSG